MIAKAHLGGDVIFVRANVVEADAVGEVVVLNVDTATCYGLNRTASHVWRMLAEPLSFADVRDRLVAAFEVEPSICERDLRALLLGLESEGLLKRLR